MFPYPYFETSLELSIMWSNPLTLNEVKVSVLMIYQDRCWIQSMEGCSSVPDFTFRKWNLINTQRVHCAPIRRCNQPAQIINWVLFFFIQSNADPLFRCPFIVTNLINHCRRRHVGPDGPGDRPGLHLRLALLHAELPGLVPHAGLLPPPLH